MAERSASLTTLLDELTVTTARGFTNDEASLVLDSAPAFSPFASPVVPTVQMSLNDTEVEEEPLSSHTAISSGKYTDIFKTWSFPIMSLVSLTVRLSLESDGRVLSLLAEAPSDSEWSLLTQLRVRSGVDEGNMKVLDRDIFEFTRYKNPVRFKLHQDISVVKFELRTINEFFRRHPSFTEGDVTLRFKDGSTIVTSRALLSVSSPYMAVKMSTTESGGVVDVSPFERYPFVQLLLQLYPTERPIWASFKNLAMAAVSFDARVVVGKLSEYMVDFRKMPVYRRLVDAASYNLYPAVAAIVEEAARTGVWMNMIHNGFEPQKALGEAIYTSVVCPSVVRAKFPASTLPAPSVPIDLTLSLPKSILSPSSADSPFNVLISLLGTPFYVNRGILAVHGGGHFAMINDNHLCCAVTPELAKWCARTGTSPGEAFLSLLCSLYPFGPDVSSNLIRPALAIAAEHEFVFAVEKLEQALISEPVTTAAQLLEHLQLAERFSLKNLVRATALRAEGSCKELLNDAVLWPDFQKISIKVRQPILDRLCSGWAHGWSLLGNRAPTDSYERTLAPACGHPRREASDCATFRSIESDIVFEHREELTIEG